MPTLRTVLDGESEPLRRALLYEGMAEWLGDQEDRRSADAASVAARLPTVQALRERASIALDQAVVETAAERHAWTEGERAEAGADFRRWRRDLERRLDGELARTERLDVPPVLQRAAVTAEVGVAFDAAVAARHREFIGPGDVALVRAAARANAELGGLLRASVRQALRAEEAEQAAAEELLLRDQVESHVSQVAERVLEARAIDVALGGKAALSSTTSEERDAPSPSGRLLGEAAIMRDYADREVERFRVREGTELLADRLGGLHTDPERKAEARRQAADRYRDEKESLSDEEARTQDLRAARIRLRFAGIARPRFPAVQSMHAAAVDGLQAVAATDARRQVAFARQSEPPLANADRETSAGEKLNDAGRRFATEPEVAALYAQAAGPPERRPSDNTTYQFRDGAWVAKSPAPRLSAAATPGLGIAADARDSARGAGRHEPDPESQTGRTIGPSAESSRREPHTLELRREPGE